MSKPIMTTDDFWNMLKEEGVIPEDLNRVTSFSFSGEPGKPLKFFVVTLVEEEKAKKLIKLLKEYDLEIRFETEIGKEDEENE
ncbi:MAG: hypothetical protein ACP5D6_09015 [Kosmotogaceae bacterium]